MRWPRSGQSPTLLLFLAKSMSDLTMHLGTPAWSAARASLTAQAVHPLSAISFIHSSVASGFRGLCHDAKRHSHSFSFILSLIARGMMCRCLIHGILDDEEAEQIAAELKLRKGQLR